MLVCFTTDLHGSAPLYEQLTELLTRERPEILILGGDLFADGQVDDPVRSQAAYINETFIPRVTRWRQELRNLEVAVLLGNHDWTATARLVEQHAAAGHVVTLSLETAWRVGGTSITGYHHTPWTPHYVKDFERLDLPGDPIPPDGDGLVCDDAAVVRQVSGETHFGGHASIEEELASAPQIPPPWIFVCHAPPYDSKLDRLPQVEAPIGSRAIRRFIEQRQPLLALHGHVHESVEVTGSYRDLVGRSLCVNPGQGHERLHAVLFELENPAATLRHTVYR